MSTEGTLEGRARSRGVTGRFNRLVRPLGSGRSWGRDGYIEESHATRSVALRDRRYKRSLALADMGSAMVALVFCSTLVGSGHLRHPALLLGLPLVVLASKVHGLYERDELVMRKTTIDEAPALFQLAALYTLLAWLSDGVLFGGELTTKQAVVLWITLWVTSLLFRRAARTAAGRSAGAERLLLIGDAGTYQRLNQKLELAQVNAQLVGRMTLQRAAGTKDERPVDEDMLRIMLKESQVERVLIVPSQTDPQVTLDLVRTVKALGVRVSIVPHVLDVVGNAVVFDDIAGMTVLGLRQFDLSRSSRAIKRGLDLVGATLLLVAVFPLMAAIAVAIRLDSRGPVFFRQVRVGKDGRRFRIFKFRTMVPDAEARKQELLAFNEANGLFKMAEDPRITRVGRLLRRTSLDELPQLVNVLRGEMSLVGPRPLILSEDESITGHDRRRLHLTPGMTGHWQIMGSSRVPMHEMVKIDYLYVTTWTIFEDIKILVRTVPYMLARRGL